MAKSEKAIVLKSDTLDQLELRVGRVITAELEASALKRSYRIEIDFGKFGKRTSVGRFTEHQAEDLIGKQVVGVLNLGEVEIGDVKSQVLILGSQFPKAASGEATILTTLTDVKIGSRVF